MKHLVAFCLTVFLSFTAWAVEPNEILDDPALEERAREISKLLRCVVCQNENIDSSNAPLARDLRLVVRERLEEGDSDEEVLAFVVQRYGEFVLLKPKVRSSTFVLWFGPAIVLLIGLTGLAIYYRNRRRAAAAVVPLSADEEKRLKELLGDD